MSNLATLTVVMGTPSAVVAREHQAVAEAHERGLVAQFDGKGFGLGQFFAADGGQTRLQLELIGLSEGKALDAKTILRHAQREFRFRVEFQIVFVLRGAGGIELAREDETGFRRVARCLNLKAAESEIGRGRFGYCRDRRGARRRGGFAGRSGGCDRVVGYALSLLSDITHSQKDRRHECHDDGKSNQHALHRNSPRSDVRRREGFDAPRPVVSTT